jgi:hypothetical protein
MLESLSADIRQGSPAGQSQGALDKAHQLIPIQKFLTSVKNDVKETKEAITAVSPGGGGGEQQAVAGSSSSSSSRSVPGLILQQQQLSIRPTLCSSAGTARGNLHSQGGICTARGESASC